MPGIHWKDRYIPVFACLLLPLLLNAQQQDRKDFADPLIATLARAQIIADTAGILSAAAQLKDLYRREGRLKEALAMYELETAMKDSLNNRQALDRKERFAFRQRQLADSVANEEVERRLAFDHEQVMRKERNQRNGFLFGTGGVLMGCMGIWFGLRSARRRRELIRKEKDRSEGLLLNILPAEVAKELKRNGQVEARHFDQATILFSAFGDLAETLAPADLVDELDTCFKAFDRIITERGIEKIKTIGNVYMCAGGLPDPGTSSPLDVVLAGIEMQAFMHQRKRAREAQHMQAFTMKVGIHTGPVVAGIVGVKKFQYDIWGDTVNIASRMQSSGQVGAVNIGGSTYELVRSAPELTFTSRGKVLAKGKGEMEMYFVAAQRSAGS